MVPSHCQASEPRCNIARCKCYSSPTARNYLLSFVLPHRLHRLSHERGHCSDSGTEAASQRHRKGGQPSMSRASVRHIVRCSWWLAVTGMTISLSVWLIVRHDRHTAAVLELMETQGYALDAGSLLGAFLNALLPEGISLLQAM